MAAFSPAALIDITFPRLLSFHLSGNIPTRCSEHSSSARFHCSNLSPSHWGTNGARTIQGGICVYHISASPFMLAFWNFVFVFMQHNNHVRSLRECALHFFGFTAIRNVIERKGLDGRYLLATAFLGHFLSFTHSFLCAWWSTVTTLSLWFWFISANLIGHQFLHIRGFFTKCVFLQEF